MRSHWGRLEFQDQDRLAFLHNQSTNAFKTLQPGQGCETVFVTATARTIDLATAYITEDSVLVVVSPHRRQQLLDWCDRYIFFGDKVKITDVTTSTATFSLIGPQSAALLNRLGLATLPEMPHSHQLALINDQPLRLAQGSGLVTPGFTLILDQAHAADLWQTLTEQGACPLGEQVWQQLRIRQGRPQPESELTEDYNPLEVGLWQSISFDKGCYIGQETIARLNTYQGVKQRLWGVQLSQGVDPGTVMRVADQKVGLLTSCVATPQGWFGLGYVKTKAGGAGTEVSLADQRGQLLDLPFVTHPLPSP
ncbi:MAG: folate-binding protein YgfZ [Acaryochloridaceae cyanobacterium SU_2_1]|nr:folate-binding protein YgfZ [Acaryochloridaceae cyanobacterium SU_2_1]